MNIRGKAARLIMSHISDRAGDDPSVEYARVEHEIRDLGIGGLCLFGGQADRTPEMIRRLSECSAFPLLVASDLERGLGQQVRGATAFPSLAMCGATGDPRLAQAQGWVTGSEARRVGINLVFAPVADVDSEPTNPIIGVRAFGTEPSMVADFTCAFVRGLQAAGVAATAKHFPGHGDTKRDSHIELPVVDADSATIHARELVPFRAAIDEGVKVIMTAHVAYPGLQSNASDSRSTDSLPATLAPDISTALLRGDLGFEGLVVTDALLMGGITESYGPGEAVVLALEAGADMLLMPPDVEAAIDGIVEATESGRLSEERLDASIARAEELLGWLASRAMPGPAPGGLSEGLGITFEEPATVAAAIATRGVTLLSDETGLIPLPAEVLSGAVSLVAVTDPKQPDGVTWLRERLESQFPGAELIILDVDCSEAEASGIIDNALTSELCIIALFDEISAWKGHSGPDGTVAAVITRLLAASWQSIALLFAGPQLAHTVEGADAILCCYDGSQPAQLAGVAALLGEAEISGRGG
jgi:beta-glucosidase-like glycosyl hydrolase